MPYFNYNVLVFIKIVYYNYAINKKPIRGHLENGSTKY